MQSEICWFTEAGEGGKNKIENIGHIVFVDAAPFLSEAINMRVAFALSERKTEMCTADGETKLKISTKALDI